MKGMTVLAIGLLTLVAGGCERAAERSVERMVEGAMREAGTDAEVEISEDGVRITSEGEGGRATIEMAGDGKLDLPDGFPDDMPVFPGSDVTYSATAADEGISTILTSAESASAIYEYYLEQLPSHDWEIDHKMEMAGMYMLHALKGEREVTLTISGEGGESTINLTLAGGG